ncbi:MAG: glycosyltransferase, partial [Acidithiobacillus sp.]|uniref:glycosyltransferase n=1 Tax=Acidithiobacillus sp. TaxID=1872118 RepID=UPI0035600061
MKKILLIPDIPNWAFDRDADAIIKYLPEYQFEKMYSVSLDTSKFSKFDKIHFMNWYDGQNYCNITSASVSSHNFEFLHHDLSLHILPKFSSLVATSQKLYDKICKLNKNVIYAPGGVHHDIFVPYEKQDTDDFIVGWVGQPTKGGIPFQNKTVDIKGYNLILQRLIDRFINVRNIKFKVLCHPPNCAISYKNMPNFYKDVDCQICTSFAEGAPNPMFEAASCGKALISTNVGAISECIKPKINGYLINIEYT